jgi:hypothetical protein
MHDAPSITQDLEVQEQQWDYTSQDPQFSKAQETPKKNNILKRAAIPYLDPDVPEIDINRLDSGRWEAKVTLSGGGDTTSLAIRDLVSMTLKVLEELI